ncbi:MAG: flavodoxin-dependent (E)-4-hydroxy-3-methylbut-2-enyl-diphosphate synthase [Firmicutes bacterium]|nr:flavodoxin-dependent (E)-4-hydroxy-3-methylbut-2-enyl-diphosphate synthase [Bacillota bacterium]
MNYNEIRRHSRKIKVGRLFIGGDAPVSVQSMTNVQASDAESTAAQVLALEKAGCDIVRIAVPDMDAVKTVYSVKEAGAQVPLVADIHFNYRIALECAAAGIDKIRINPGNIGGDDRVKAVVDACRAAGIPIRIGVNSGSLEKELLAKYGSPTPEALAESAMRHVRLLEKFDFNEIIIAVKSSDAGKMIKTNRILAEMCDYPLHLGVTEAGTAHIGTIKSAVGIGALLCDGIGDTIRVSLTDSPLKEVEEGKAILRALGIGSNSITITSCPTCGRTKIDIIALANELEARTDEIHNSRPIRIAVMGCAVNGPGEARDADIGIAGGSGEALLFRRGTIIGKLPEAGLVGRLIDEINRMESI